MDQAGPVAISLKSLSNGVKTTVRQGQPSATMPVIAYTGATLLIGHSAPRNRSAIACRPHPIPQSQIAYAEFLVPVTAERPSLAVKQYEIDLLHRRPCRVPRYEFALGGDHRENTKSQRPIVLCPGGSVFGDIALDASTAKASTYRTESKPTSRKITWS